MSKSDLTLEERKTIQWYSDQAILWAQKHGLSGDKELMFQPEMEMLFKMIPEGKILEVGTGHGGDAIQLIKHYGLDKYHGVDASEGLLSIARQRNLGADLRVATVYNLGFPENYFDGFWISAMLIHVPKNKFAKALGEINRVTKLNGVGFISAMEGSADMENSRPGRYYSLWQQDEFQDELSKAGFRVIHRRKIETTESPWMIFLVKKL